MAITKGVLQEVDDMSLLNKEVSSPLSGALTPPHLEHYSAQAYSFVQHFIDFLLFQLKWLFHVKTDETE